MKTGLIMIAVDAALVALELELSLQELGLATYSADSVANAIRFVHDQGLDFAIVDTRLGNEDTGDIAAHLVVKDVKFVMLDEGGNFEKQAGNGASHVLQKPVYASEIIDCVRRFLPAFAL